MALPAGITPKTVTLGIGSFFDGTLVDGTVTITAPVNVVHTPTGSPLFSSALSKKFTDGSVTFDLCPTDDPGLNRVDWTYKLSVKVTGALVQPDPIYFTLPVAGPDTVDLDSLVSVPSSAGTPVSVSVLTAADLDSTMADEVTAGGSATAAAIAADPQLRAAFDAQASTSLTDPTTGMGATALATFAQPAETLRPVRLQPSMFQIGQGAPTSSVLISRFPVWNFRHGSADRVNTSFTMPYAPGKVDIDLLWCPIDDTARPGVVAWRCHIAATSLGDSPSTVDTQPIVNVTVGSQNKLVRTRLASAYDLTKAQSPLLMIERTGTDVSDTLTASVAMVGVVISPVASYPGILVDNGGWCWFNEPRLLAHQGTKNQVYASYVNGRGSTGVASLNTDTKAIASFTLHSLLGEIDDHDTPGLVVRPDGKLMAFYSRHSVTDDPIYFRVSTNIEDVTAWDAEQTIVLPTGGQPCYPKPVYLGTRLYVFFRNALNQDFIYSDDNGGTWSTPATLFQWHTGWRGYVNMVQNGARVDFICNDDNPNTSSNCNLYHAYLTGGNVYKTDGTLIGPLGGTGGAGFTTDLLTKVYDYTTDGDAWGWDIQLDGNGRPVCVFATFPGGSTASTADTDHHYKYAYWTGSAWVVKAITNAGPTIADRGAEYRYSGGLALLSSNTSVVYLSRQVGTTWEVEKWTTADQGTTWTHYPLTVHSREKNVRPTTPEGHYVGAPEVVWEAGLFVTFNYFLTRLIYN